MQTSIPLWMRLGWLVGRILRLFRWRRKPTWLILKPGSLGDALLFSGVLTALRRQRPEIRIILATNRRASAIFQGILDRRRMLVLDDFLGNPNVVNRVQRIWFAIRLFCRRYDVVLYPASWTTAQWSHSAYSLLDAIRKYHFPEAFTNNTTDPANYDVVTVPPLTHELDRMMAIFRAAGGHAETRADIWPAMPLTEVERTFGREAIARSAGEGLSGTGGMEHGARSSELGVGSGEWGGKMLNAECRMLPLEADPPRAGNFECGEQGAGKLGKRTSNIERRTSNVQPITKHEERSTKNEESNNQPPITDNHERRTLRVAVCAGARYKQKDWGWAKFVGLLGRLTDSEFLTDYGYAAAELLFLGEQGDWENNEKIIARLSVNCCQLSGSELGDLPANNNSTITNNRLSARNLAGRTSLRQSVAVIAACDLCIGNDTFGLHAAISEHVPSVVILGRQAGDLWSPWGDPSIHRAATLAPFPCEKPGCGADCQYSPFLCTKYISVAHVLKEVMDVLGAMQRALH